MHPNIKDMRGKTFKRLTVLEYDHSYNGRAYWVCECDCGNTTVTATEYLTSGDTTSCGCRKVDMITGNKYNYKHGGNNTVLYGKYQSAKQRCEDEGCSDYERYGGRGIRFMWDDFEDFKDDMGESYQKHLKEYGPNSTTLDRIDNDGNYCKENCKWSTVKEQSRNRRSNHEITYQGETKTIAGWAEEVGINRETLYSRINKIGWPIEKALTTPVQGQSE